MKKIIVLAACIAGTVGFTSSFAQDNMEHKKMEHHEAVKKAEHHEAHHEAVKREEHHEAVKKIEHRKAVKREEHKEMEHH